MLKQLGFVTHRANKAEATLEQLGLAFLSYL